jgi:hypothetical protein
MNRIKVPLEDIQQCREKVLRAFKSLRKENIRARANFWCCMGCATAALDIKGKKGGVYWHNQDEERFREDGYLHIGFCTEDGKTCQALGQSLVDALKAQGADVEWDGTSDTRVCVYAEGARESK